MNKVILLYGMPAAGKYTIAKMIADRHGCFLVDNHYIHDFIRPLISNVSKNEEYFLRAGNILNELMEIIGVFHDKDKPVTYVFTLVIRDDEIGVIEAARYEKLAKAINGQFIPIALVPSYETRKERCATEARKQRRKISSVEKMDKVIGSNAKLLNIKHENGLVLDTTNMSIEETFSAVEAHLEKFD